ncbi:MAG: hypothetical protein AAF660_04900 [Pseudomonadota bacterium]
MALEKFYKSLIIMILPVICSAQDTTPQPATPCQDDPRFSEFDFWLGEWDVHDAGGTFAGVNRIEKVHNGCLLTESWEGVGGLRGSSINFVDKVSGEWVQVWNDAIGGQVQIRGGIDEAGMRLEGTLHYVSNSKTLRFRGLWTPLDDGRVRQYFEQSEDGQSWSPWFEGFYTRRETGSGER